MTDLFGGPTIEDVCLADMLAEVTRELAQRERVYPRLVEAGKLSQADADRQMLCMRAVETYLSKMSEIR